MIKRNHPITTALLFIGLATLACGISIDLTPEAIPATKPVIPTLETSQPAEPQIIALVTQSLEENSVQPPYRITAQIPLLQSVQGDLQESHLHFNQLVKDLLITDVDSFRANLEQFAPDPPMTAGSFYDLKYSLESPPGEVLSLKFTIDTYFDGAAHPGSYSLTFTYDLATGQPVSLENLFLPGADYLAVIASFCKGQLSSRDIAYFEEGADPTVENYRNWNISEAGLLISFDPYQVAAYAAGPQTVLIPYEELVDLIDPQGPLGDLVK